MSISSESISYGEIANETLLNIFGAEMTYNELKFYAKNINETTHLQVKIITVKARDTQIVIALFDNQEVFEREYPLNHSCDMFYFLNEIKPDEDSDDEEEEIDYCRHCEEVLHYCVDHEKYCHKCCDCEDCKKACDEELEYDDNGVLCKYSQEDGWTPIEDHCVECGFKPDECICEL